MAALLIRQGTPQRTNLLHQETPPKAKPLMKTPLHQTRLQQGPRHLSRPNQNSIASLSRCPSARTGIQAAHTAAAAVTK